MVINGLIDVIGLAFILPVLYVINDSSVIYSNYYLNFLYNQFHFVSPDGFSLFLIILMFIVFLGKNFISALIIYFQYKYSNNIAIELISSQYKKYLHKDYLYFKQNNSNYILRDIATIPSEFAQGVLIPIINFSTELIVTLSITIAIGIYNPIVFLLLSIILFPSFILFYNSIKNKVDRYGIEISEIRSSTFKSIFEAIFGIEEVKLANKENYFIKRSLNPLKYYFGLNVKLNFFKVLPAKVIEIVSILGIVLIFMYGFFLGEKKNTFSLLMIFATAAYRMMPSLNRMVSSLIDIKNKSYVFDILSENSIPHKDDVENLQEVIFNKSIHINNISFKFPDKENYVLEKINILISKGDKIGLIGESGSGKSTLIKIILGFLKPETGSILIDDNLINAAKSIKWRDKIGYVQQDFYLLDCSLAENIAFGEKLSEINFEKLKNCIELAKLDSLVETLVDKEYTKVGEFGSNLSGGQRQRIAIARSLYKEVEILIFDEATSALDNKTEQEIIETINNLTDKNYTIIMITHRLSSLRFCDDIYEIKEGCIINKLKYDSIE